MGDYQRILSGQVRLGWRLLVPGTYFSGYHLLCDYAWSKEIKGDDMIRKKHDSSILISEEYKDTKTVKIRRFSTICPKINGDLAVIRYGPMVSLIHSVYLTPNMSGVVFELHTYLQSLKIVVFNAFSPKEKFAIWKITAPGTDDSQRNDDYQYGGSMFLDEHSRRLIIIFKTFTIVHTSVNTATSFPKGFAMVAYEISADYSTILNDGSGTIIYTNDIKVARCISLGDDKTVMWVVSDGENGPELNDVITINRTGIKRRQSVVEWLEINESQRPDFTHVMESYENLQIDGLTNGIFANSSLACEWCFPNNVMSRCVVGAWYARTGRGILCKRTRADSLKNLAAKALVGVYPLEIDGPQLRADMKTMVGFDIFEAVGEEKSLSVEV